MWMQSAVRCVIFSWFFFFKSASRMNAFAFFRCVVSLPQISKMVLNIVLSPNNFQPSRILLKILFLVKVIEFFLIQTQIITHHSLTFHEIAIFVVKNICKKHLLWYQSICCCLELYSKLLKVTLFHAWASLKTH